MKTQTLPQDFSSFILHFLKPYKFFVLLFIALVTCAGFWGPFNSLLVKYLIDSLPLVHTEGVKEIGYPAVLIVLNFIIFDNVTWRSIEYLSYKFQPVIKNNITKETFEFILGASHQFFQDRLSGRTANHIKALADNVERILFTIIHEFIRNASLFTVALCTSYYVNPTFFYILLFWSICFYSFSIGVSRLLVNLSDAHADTESEISGQLVDCITNSSNIRIFAKKDYEIWRIKGFLQKSKTAFRREKKYLILTHIVQGILIWSMMGFVVYFLVDLYSKKLVTIGDFALILGLSVEVGHMTWYAMSHVDDFNLALGKCKQSLSSLIIPQNVQDKDNATDFIVKKGIISFHNVIFNYKDSDTIFNKKSISIDAGQKVGLVGYSGSGKSTFVSLILRLHDVVSGKVCIDGVDIRDMSQDSLRSCVSMIPQDPSLFHRTIMDNIRYSRIDATDDEVISAAKKAHAHEFIEKLSDGYTSLVGERGVKLSGGERQRIAIARAILKNAPILILDEATSQLDSVTEDYIQESLWNLMKDKTTIVIAHRLSTLSKMDRILVFEQGKIIEEGNHASLIKLKGLYYKLFSTQVSGFLLDNETDNNIQSSDTLEM